MKRRKSTRIETSGLSSAGIWVRRQLKPPALSEEALSLAQVLQTWNLAHHMTLEFHESMLAEMSGEGLPPTWFYLVDLYGQRLDEAELLSTHPLSGVPLGETVRILAIVEPTDWVVKGALVQTPHSSRLLWIRAST